MLASLLMVCANGGCRFKEESETAKLIVCALVKVTMGFEGLAISVEKPAKSVHRMLSSLGNPTMTNLAAIFSALKSTMKVDIHAHCVSVA
jgi:DNA-binding phage protein